MKSILDPTFNYIPSAQTDLRKRFADVIADNERVRAARKHPKVEITSPACRATLAVAANNVAPLKRSKKA